MSLTDDLSAYPSADEQKYTPRIEFDHGTGKGTISTVVKGGVPKDFGPIFRQMLVDSGYDPDTLQVGVRLSASSWEFSWRDRTTNEMFKEWRHAFKYELLQVQAVASSADIEALALKVKKKPCGGAGPYWFVFQAGDQQLGKRSRDGSTAEIVERYLESVENAKTEFKSLKRHGIAGIQICMPGDCLEGSSSQGGKNLWLTQETVPEQARILRRLMFYTVAEFAPLVSHVYLDVVGGNHDDAQRIQNTYPGDNWATETAIAVSDAIKLNEASFGHVEVRVPDKWKGSMTVPVGDTVVTVVHGHQWRRGKALDWWASQAVNDQPAGGSQVLQHGHWHEWMVNSNAKRTIIASPTFDMGSDWYREKTGATSRRGGLVYLLNAGDVSRMSVV